jgi:hypothetical protein
MADPPKRPRPKALRKLPALLDKAILHVEKRRDRARYRAWFAGAELTVDWTSGNFPRWRKMLEGWRDQELRILEVGTFEGRASVFFLNFFPRATLTGIDWFEGFPDAAARFDRNMAPYGDRVEALKMDSVAALERLRAENRTFDLVYIDVSHYHDTAKANTRAAWPLTQAGSVIIWDDYNWGRHLPDAQRGKGAIDDFLREREGDYRVLGKGYQLAIERLR